MIRALETGSSLMSIPQSEKPMMAPLRNFNALPTIVWCMSSFPSSFLLTARPTVKLTVGWRGIHDDDVRRRYSEHTLAIGRDAPAERCKTRDVSNILKSGSLPRNQRIFIFFGVFVSSLRYAGTSYSTKHCLCTLCFDSSFGVKRLLLFF